MEPQSLAIIIMIPSYNKYLESLRDGVASYINCAIDKAAMFFFLLQTERLASGKHLYTRGK